MKLKGQSIERYIIPNGVISSSELDDAIEAKFLNELKQCSVYARRDDQNRHKIKMTV
jgi:magnesium-transporting ATPase (P-type)